MQREQGLLISTGDWRRGHGFRIGDRSRKGCSVHVGRKGRSQTSYIDRLRPRVSGFLAPHLKAKWSAGAKIPPNVGVSSHRSGTFGMVRSWVFVRIFEGNTPRDWDGDPAWSSKSSGSG